MKDYGVVATVKLIVKANSKSEAEQIAKDNLDAGNAWQVYASDIRWSYLMDYMESK